MGFLILLYVLLMGTYGVWTFLNFLDWRGYEDEEETQAARLFLFTPIWPIPTAYLIWVYVVRVAFPKKEKND